MRGSGWPLARPEAAPDRSWRGWEGSLKGTGNISSGPPTVSKGARGNVTRETDPLGRTTVYNYGANNIDLLEVRQVNGQTTDLLWSAAYNSQHGAVAVTDASGQTWHYTYNGQGQLASMTTPARAGITETRTTTYSYDASDYLQGITGPAAGATTGYTYDGYGRIRTVTDSEGETVTYDYDALDRVTKITYPDGTYEQTVYNRLDPEQGRDRLGRWTHTFYDALRRVTAVRDPLGETTTYEWCNCGSLDKITDPKGNARTFERDIQGRLTREVRADTSATAFTYENTTSRLLQKQDAKGQTIGYQYFPDNDLKQIAYTSAQVPTPNVSFTYDPVYNRLATMTDGTGTTNYSFNPVAVPPSLGAARLASVDGPLPTDTVAYGYDEHGRAISRTINGVSSVQSFDSLGRIAGETNALGAFSYTYVGATGRPSTAAYPNGQTTTLSYFDNAGDHRLKEILNQLPGGAILSKLDYTREPTGRLKTWSQQTDANPAKTYTFGFDLGDQVTGATLTDQSSSILKTYGYGYDNAGNRTFEAIDSTAVAASFDNVNRLTSQQGGGVLPVAGSLSEPATVTVNNAPASVSAANQFAGSAQVGTGTQTFTVEATDASGNKRTNTYQINVTGSGSSFAYDANGNLFSNGTRTFEWDAENRLTAVSQGTHRSEFTYDGTGRRVREIEKDGAAVLSDHWLLWCGLRICEERDSTGGTVTRRFFSQGVQEGTTAYFYTGDHLGSIREMTDATGVVRARYEYDPFGRRTKVSGDKDAAFGFTGHYVHAATGLVLAPDRVYDPSLGRWLSEDPLGLEGGDTNLYRYALNRPTNLVDPTGQIVVVDDAIEAYFLATLATMTAVAAINAIQHLPPLPPFTIPDDPGQPGPPPSGPPTGMPPGPPSGGPPAVPVPPAVPAPLPNSPPTPMPPPVPPVPVPTKPIVQVPSGPKVCEKQKLQGDPCVLLSLCLQQAKGWAKIKCVPLLLACIARHGRGI